ncbi:MAG: cell division protein FtsA [Anderseniella sp.]|nr:cell division protein FtsA [Anderseniella sp.]
MKVVQFPGGGSSSGGAGVSLPSRIAALDIGSTKICCLIGEVAGGKRRAVDERVPGVTIIGSGHCRSAGVRGGHVVDVREAERAVRVAIEQAERMSGATLSEVYVNLSGARCKSVHATASTQVQSGQVSQADMRRAITAALAQVETNGMAVLHVSVNHYRLDDARGVREPDNMHCKSLEADINVVLADPNMMANLGHVLERCHLDVAGFVVSSYAASRAALLEDEMELGVALVELGGGTTSYAVFNEGVLAAAGALPVGSHHVTADIARGLNTPLAHAERVKTLWGSAVPAMLDERELITCPILGETGTDAVNRIPRSMICGVIRPRMEEIFEMLRERLADVPAMRQGIRRVVLTGGGSQLNGVEQLAGEMLRCSVRIARPHRFDGLPDAMAQPGFAVASGLLRYGLVPDRQATNLGQLIAGAGHDAGYFRRVGQWLKESF